MFWALLRNAACTRFPGSIVRFHHQSLGYSGSSGLSSVGTSLNVWRSSRRRTICSVCSKKLVVVKTCTRQAQGKPLKLEFSSLFREETRRFAGTRVGFNSSSAFNERNRTTAIYVIALAITVVGFSYLAVPLYRLFCQVSYVPPTFCGNEKYFHGIILIG